MIDDALRSMRPIPVFALTALATSLFACERRRRRDKVPRTEPPIFN